MRRETDDNERRPFESCIRDGVVPEGEVLTGWVIVTETIRPDGTKFLSFDASEDMTDWQRRGMLNEAASMDNDDPLEG